MVAGDFRKGTTFEKDGKVFRVVDFQHVKPGKGSAFVRTKYKNVVTGQVLEESFSPTEKFLDARIDTKAYQFLYADDDFAISWIPRRSDQINVNIDDCRDALKYIIPEMMVSIQSYKEVPFSVEPPNFVELTVAETEPGIQGDTSKAGNKPRDAGNGCGDPGPAVHQYRRQDPRRYENGRVYVESEVISDISGAIFAEVK